MITFFAKWTYLDANDIDLFTRVRVILEPLASDAAFLVSAGASYVAFHSDCL